MVIWSAVFLVSIFIFGVVMTSPALARARSWMLVVGNALFISIFFPPGTAVFMLAAVIAIYFFDPVLTKSKLAACTLVCGLVISMFTYRPGQAPLAFAGAVSLSFFVFHLISYTIDRHTNHVKSRPPIKEFAAFATFFPALVSGPIIRPGNFFQQARGSFGASPGVWNKFFYLFFSGLVEKFVIADRLALVQNDVLHSETQPEKIFFFYILAVRTYFDFSGYTNIARGVAALAGIELPENFRRPFMAENPIDFWRRWHISLAHFFRDYVYYPVFFRFKNLYLAAAVAFLLNGLWHGLMLNFFLLGMYWSVVVIAYLVFQRFWDQRVPRWIRVFSMLHIFVGSFVFFQPGGVAILSSAVMAVWAGANGELEKFLFNRNVGTAIFSCLMLFALRRGYFSNNRLIQYGAAFLMIWLPLSLAVYRPSRFIYSQF